MRGRRMPGGGHHVLTGGEVEREMNGGDEALHHLAPAQVGVARGQELLLRDRAKQAAERAGQQQRPGSRVHPLARHVDQRDLQGLPVAGGNQKVAAER